MGYTTKNELKNFTFAGAEVFEIKGHQNIITFELGYVSILGSNSCNRDIREMGTSELTLELQNVTKTKLVKEGFKVFDADGNPKSSCEDEEIALERYTEIYKELEHSQIYDLTFEDGVYTFYLDTEERTYTYKIKAESDRESWERFMNKEASY